LINSFSGMRSLTPSLKYFILKLSWRSVIVCSYKWVKVLGSGNSSAPHGDLFRKLFIVGNVGNSKEAAKLEGLGFLFIRCRLFLIIRDSKESPRRLKKLS
jgi:hypothetical protein